MSLSKRSKRRGEQIQKQRSKFRQNAEHAEFHVSQKKKKMKTKNLQKNAA
jgi:hypothetical protein